jgi:hypothetical protein
VADDEIRDLQDRHPGTVARRARCAFGGQGSSSSMPRLSAFTGIDFDRPIDQGLTLNI